MIIIMGKQLQPNLRQAHVTQTMSEILFQIRPRGKMLPHYRYMHVALRGNFSLREKYIVVMIIMASAVRIFVSASNVHSVLNGFVIMATTME